MFIVDQDQRSAYRADKIICVRVYYKTRGFMDGIVYATIEGMPPECAEVSLGMYDSAAVAVQVAKGLLEAVEDGYPELFYMPKHDWDPAENAEVFTGTGKQEGALQVPQRLSDRELDGALAAALIGAKP